MPVRWRRYPAFCHASPLTPKSFNPGDARKPLLRPTAGACSSMSFVGLGAPPALLEWSQRASFMFMLVARPPTNPSAVSIFQSTLDVSVDCSPWRVFGFRSAFFLRLAFACLVIFAPLSSSHDRMLFFLNCRFAYFL